MTGNVVLVRGGSAVQTSAVALIDGAVQLHVGLAFRGKGADLQVLHLASHCRLTSGSAEGWACVVPAIDVIELQVLSGLCAVLEERRPRVPYGLRFLQSRFEGDGRFVPGQGESGLTCATFVMAMFDWALIPLLDKSSWVSRDDDVQAQMALLHFLRGPGSASPEHVAALESEVGAPRFRPEEVAAASALPGRPATFRDAVAVGAEVLALFKDC